VEKREQGGGVNPAPCYPAKLRTKIEHVGTGTSAELEADQGRGEGRTGREERGSRAIPLFLLREGRLTILKDSYGGRYGEGGMEKTKTYLPKMLHGDESLTPSGKLTRVTDRRWGRKTGMGQQAVGSSTKGR